MTEILELPTTTLIESPVQLVAVRKGEMISTRKLFERMLRTKDVPTSPDEEVVSNTDGKITTRFANIMCGSELGVFERYYKVTQDGRLVDLDQIRISKLNPVYWQYRLLSR